MCLKRTNEIHQYDMAMINRIKREKLQFINLKAKLIQNNKKKTVTKHTMERTSTIPFFSIKHINLETNDISIA